MIARELDYTAESTASDGLVKWRDRIEDPDAERSLTERRKKVSELIGVSFPKELSGFMFSSDFDEWPTNRGTTERE
ncbi:hypothetical protein N657DRAFT_449164 [Parathielavia appendiculata]|uniref:Uncharacterized protein n=1 Tax=Parathielavia appendiculata TaxID=2587402 RepID=A0AAN6TYN6_9PEZI|nr:hypothetical protein N657DRAFT_449164 [Parathielavia appendiculata]